jgi:hypothetical protein
MPPGGESVANCEVDVEMDMFMTDLLGDDRARLENGHFPDAERTLYTVLWPD